MTIGPDRLTQTRWFFEADKGASSGGGAGGDQSKAGAASTDAKPGDGDTGKEGKGDNPDPPAPVEKQATIKLADNGAKVVIDGVEYVVQTRVNELVGSAREEGRTKGKTELEEEARAAALKEQGDFKALYEAEQKKVADLTAERDAERISNLRSTAAAKFNLHADLIDRIKGDDEKTINADAERLSKLFGDRKPVDTEGGQGNRTRRADGNAGTQPKRRYAFQKEGDVSWADGKPVAAKSD